MSSKRVLRNSLDFELRQTGLQLELDGSVVTSKADTKEYVGRGHFHAIGFLRQGEFAQLLYSLDNNTVHGFGVIFFQFAPNGLTADGYLLFRRTTLENGRMGFGRALLKRQDAPGADLVR